MIINDELEFFDFWSQGELGYTKIIISAQIAEYGVVAICWPYWIFVWQTTPMV
jgi:hypothetical protein